MPIADEGAETECGEDMPAAVKYYLCNFVVYESSHQVYNTPLTVNDHGCVKSATRFTLNTTTVKAKKRFNGSLTDCGRCSSAQTV